MYSSRSKLLSKS